MMVFWDAKLVYLATPKTASTAIESALRPFSSMNMSRTPQLKHTSFNRYQRFLQPFLNTASKTEWRVVAMMREPTDWLNSWYRYRSREDLSLVGRSTRNISFDQFVQDWCQDTPPEHAKVGSQQRFLRPHRGHSPDKIFRYEDFHLFHAFMEHELNCTLNFTRQNSSPQGENALSPATRALLEQKAAPDYALYASLA